MRTNSRFATWTTACWQRLRRESDVAFGKPAWFAKGPWGLKPVAWQGWAYVVTWATAVVVPGLVLLGYRGLLFSAVWCAFSSLCGLLDARLILRSMDGPKTLTNPDVLVIADDEGASRLDTRNFHMQVRDL